MKPFDSFLENEKSILIKLEKRDSLERNSRVDKKERLRQIPRESGEFLYHFLKIHSNKKKPWIGVEIGSSGGYSTIWHGLALKHSANGHLFSLDIDERKFILAKENITISQLQSYVTIINADAKVYLQNFTHPHVDYVFLDAEKEDYLTYYNLIKSLLISGSVLIADNVISHKSDLGAFLKILENDNEILYSVLQIGKGLAFVQKI